MDITLDGGPAYTQAYISLDAGECVHVESGAMTMMSANIDVSAGTAGGVGRALTRKALGGESFFMGVYRATRSGAWVAVAPKSVGDIGVVDLQPGEPPLLVTHGALLAAADTVDIKMRPGNAVGLALRESVMMVQLSGHGKALVSAVGALQRFDLGPGESIIVDTGHLVGWSTSIESAFGGLANARTAVATGEGIVGQFTGPGQVWCQTRAHGQIMAWLTGDR